MSAQQEWPIRGYWISFNPKNHLGRIALQLDNDAPPDVDFKNLSPEDVSAMAAILSRGGAFYHVQGFIGVKN
jgi:hypothetical protein